jgi:hypothetical protein
LKLLKHFAALALVATVVSSAAAGEVSATDSKPTINLDGSLDTLQDYFSKHDGELRFITLLSPT